MSATSTGSELKFVEIHQVLKDAFGNIDGIYDDREGELSLKEVAAELYAIAYQPLREMVNVWGLERGKNTRLRQLRDQLKEQRDGLDNELTKAQARIKELEPPGKPDPLGMALPRGSGKPDVVRRAYCKGGAAAATRKTGDRKQAQCPSCSRWLQSKFGYVPRHMVPR